MEHESTPPPKKKILNGKFHNKTPVGKPRTRWEDAVRRYTSQILGIRGWNRRAEDGEEWSVIWGRPGLNGSSAEPLGFVT